MKKVNLKCTCLLFPFQLLTNHYERCWKYYCLPNGWANFGVTSEEELHLSRKLFWGIFESLAHKVDQERFICQSFTILRLTHLKHLSRPSNPRNLMQSYSRSPCPACVP